MPHIHCLGLIAPGPRRERAQCSQRAASQVVGTFEGFVRIHIAGEISGALLSSKDPAGVGACLRGRAEALPHAAA